VDIPKGRLYRYDPVTGAHEVCLEGEPIGGYTIQPDGALLLFMARGAIRLWNNGPLKTLRGEIPDERESRFNDVIADPAGRVFCGTMPTPKRLARLYRLDPDGTLTVVAEEVGLANGLGFTPDRRGLYFTDTHAQTIFLYDYDVRSGAISSRRVFAQNPPEDGRPDGMTVDAEGCVWSARWDGSCLVRFAPNGRELSRVVFPVKKVSSAIFGGPDYADLYVTTAGGEQREKDGALAGSLFRLRPGGRGMPDFYSRIKV
jgi:D-xylonolactonase